MIICLQKKEKGERFLSESYFHLIAFTESDAQESIQFNEQIQDGRKDQIRMKKSSHNVFSKLPYQVKRRSFLPVSSSKNCVTMMGCASKNIAKILSYIDNCGHMAEYVSKNIARIFDKQ